MPTFHITWSDPTMIGPADSWRYMSARRDDTGEVYALRLTDPATQKVHYAYPMAGDVVAVKSALMVALSEIDDIGHDVRAHLVSDVAALIFGDENGQVHAPDGTRITFWHPSQPDRRLVWTRGGVTFAMEVRVGTTWVEASSYGRAGWSIYSPSIDEVSHVAGEALGRDDLWEMARQDMDDKARLYGERSACKKCGLDIEYIGPYGGAEGWHDRGGNLTCSQGEGEVHEPNK